MIRPGIRRILRLFDRSWRDAAAQVDEEIRFHIESRVEQLMRRGLSRTEARAEAMRRFGSMDDARRMRRAAGLRNQRMRIRDWLLDAGEDLRLGVRTLLREPLFAVVVVVTLALGTGANAAMFGVVDRLLLRGPDHVVDADAVHRLYMTQRPEGIDEWTSATFGYVEYALQEENAKLYDVAAYTNNEGMIGRGQAARPAQISYATSDVFSLLQVQPHLGRFFNAAEDSPNAPRVAVIGYALWQSMFAGERAVIGKTVDVGAASYTIVGVAPKGLTGVELKRVDLWLPMVIAGTRTAPDWQTAWDSQWLKVIARLRPGTTPEQAAAEATSVHRRGFTGDDKAFGNATLSFRPISFNEAGGEPAELAISRWLIGVSLVVLLIACANVANLLLARAVRRKREVAVRLVLGISRTRLARLLFAEALLLALAGAALGLVLANWGGQFLRAILLPDVEWSESPVNTRVLLFGLAVALATALIIGALPLLQATSTHLSETLKSGAREGGGRRSFTRSALTVAQAALSVVLLVGAGLFVKSLSNVRALDLGIEPEQIIIASIGWPRFPNLDDEAEVTRIRAHRQRVLDQAVERARQIGGLESVSSAIGTPFRSSFTVRLRIPERDSLPRLGTGGPFIAAVGPDYFETAGTQIVQGRGITDDDRPTGELVAVVNQTMARTLWPGQNPLGKCLLVDDAKRGCTRVVGVSEDARRFQLREQPSMQYYIPIGQEQGIGGRALMLRPRGDFAPLADRLRRDLLALDPSILYVTFETLQESVDPQVRPWRLGASMFVLFGGLALLIALVGLYSLIAYLVSSRTQELGVRMALGARASDILRMILGQATALTALGIGIGVSLALLAAGRLEGLLFDVSPRDPVIFGTIALLLLMCALIASISPARRAVRIDPASSLRAE